MRGTMLWFNAEKDLGALRTEDDVRMEVPGAAFAAGQRPVGRCAGKPIEFDLAGATVCRIVFVAVEPPRRARMHRRG
jgi:hypothetical protein